MFEAAVDTMFESVREWFREQVRTGKRIGFDLADPEHKKHEADSDDATS